MVFSSVIRFVNIPEWFAGKDVMIESVSFLILIAFFILAYRYYKISKKKSFLYLGWGFLLIAIAELANIATRLVLYSDVSFVQQVGQMIITYDVIKSVDIVYQVGFFFHKFLTLLGLFIIYRLPFKKVSRQDTVIIIYFMFLLALFGTGMDIIFHLTILIFLLSIIRNFYEVYSKNKNTNTMLIVVTFCILTLGHILYLTHNPAYEVTANFIELVSYLILLFLVIRILRHSKKS